MQENVQYLPYHFQFLYEYQTRLSEGTLVQLKHETNTK